MNYYISSPDSSSAGSYYESSLSFNGSRPESTSPILTQSYPAFAKLKQEASRGFEAEDDNEFCPALVPYTPQAAAAAAAPTPAAQNLHAHARTVHRSSVRAQAHNVDTAPMVAVRANKALEIIDPSTGLPIGRR